MHFLSSWTHAHTRIDLSVPVIKSQAGLYFLIHVSFPAFSLNKQAPKPQWQSEQCISCKAGYGLLPAQPLGALFIARRGDGTHGAAEAASWQSPRPLPAPPCARGAWAGVALSGAEQELTMVLKGAARGAERSCPWCWAVPNGAAHGAELSCPWCWAVLPVVRLRPGSSGTCHKPGLEARAKGAGVPGAGLASVLWAPFPRTARWGADLVLVRSRRCDLTVICVLAQRRCSKLNFSSPLLVYAMRSS